ncbi:hypothetical protein [Aquirufa aurantiipilula]
MMKQLARIFLVCALLVYPCFVQAQKFIEGSWSNTQGDVTSWLLVTDQLLSFTQFETNSHKLIATYGGTYRMKGKELEIQQEWNSQDSLQVGQLKKITFQKKKRQIQLEQLVYTPMDKGESGKMKGAWIIVGNFSGDIMSRRPNPFFPRRTMKMHTGNAFQWIAYNVQTKQFFGTGGGFYSTQANNYTEEIVFFTKASSSIGKKLIFDFQIQDGIWRHKGQKSIGGAMDEAWSRRELLDHK